MFFHNSLWRLPCLGSGSTHSPVATVFASWESSSSTCEGDKLQLAAGQRSSTSGAGLRLELILLLFLKALQTLKLWSHQVIQKSWLQHWGDVWLGPVSKVKNRHGRKSHRGLPTFCLQLILRDCLFRSPQKWLSCQNHGAFPGEQGRLFGDVYDVWESWGETLGGDCQKDRDQT